MKRLPRIAALFFIGTMLGGCALTNPYVEFEKDYQRQSLKSTDGVPLSEAIGYATQTQLAYREALGDRAEFRTLLGAGLIPLAAATAALGIHGGSATAMLALSMTGATGYSLGTWLESKPAERAYLAGYNAVGCAIEAVEPLRFSAADADYQYFLAALDGSRAPSGEIANVGIDQAMQLVEVQIGILRDQVSLARGLGDTRVSLANDEIAAARTALENAVTVRRNAVSLRREINRSGNQLVAAVDRITGQVDMAVLASQPDLQALSSIISGLGDTYGQFAAVPESVRPDGPAEPAKSKGLQQALVIGGASKPLRDVLTGPMNTLRSRTANLSQHVRRLADFVNAVAADKPTAALQRCGVSTESIAGDIAIEPQGAIQFGTNARSSVGRVIIGGRQPYRAMLVGNAPGLSVVQPELFGPAFVIQTGAGLAAGQYTVLVADGSGRRKTLSVVVGKPGSGGGSTDEPDEPTDERQDAPSESDLKAFASTLVKVRVDAEASDGKKVKALVQGTPTDDGKTVTVRLKMASGRFDAIDQSAWQSAVRLASGPKGRKLVRNKDIKVELAESAAAGAGANTGATKASQLAALAEAIEGKKLKVKDSAGLEREAIINGKPGMVGDKLHVSVRVDFQTGLVAAEDWFAEIKKVAGNAGDFNLLEAADIQVKKFLP